MSDPRHPAAPPPSSGYPPPGGGPAGGWPAQPPSGGGAGGQGGWPAPPGGPGGWQPPPSGGGGRRPLVIALGVIVVLALVGVGALVLTKDSDDSPSGPPEGVTLADLEPALLTEADVGTDYWLDELADDDADEGGFGDEFDASDECEAAMEAAETDEEAREEISVGFTNRTDGELRQTISLGGDGLSTLAETRAAIEQCDTMSYSEAGAEGEITYRTSDVEGVGDDALGLTMDMVITTQGVTVSMQMYGVMWERDGIHATVSGYGGLDSSTMAGMPIDHAFVEDLARTSDQRLAGALPG